MRAERHRGGRARADPLEQALRDLLGNGDSGNRTALVETDAPGRKIGAVEEHRHCACTRGIGHGHVRIRSCVQESGAARDEAESAAVEEVEQRDGTAVSDGRGGLGPRRPDPRVDGPVRCHRACKRSQPVELDVEADAQDDAHLSVARTEIHGANRERSRSTARTRHAAETRACRTVVSGRSRDQGVEPRRPGRRPGQRPVGERGERLGDADQRDARGVVRISIRVGINRTFEAREDLVGASVNGPACGGVPLPPRHADRQERGAGCHARERPGPAGADEEACHLRAVTLQLGRLVGLGRRQRACVAADDVDSAGDSTAKERMCAVDAGVEQSNRHAAAVLV